MTYIVHGDNMWIITYPNTFGGHSIIDWLGVDNNERSSIDWYMAYSARVDEGYTVWAYGKDVSDISDMSLIYRNTSAMLQTHIVCLCDYMSW